MKCTNYACPSKLEPDPIECPEAINGCKDYQHLVTNAEKMMQSPLEMAKALCYSNYCQCCEYWHGSSLCLYTDEHPDDVLYEGCLQAALKWLWQAAEE